jgi:hypothetical protein
MLRPLAARVLIAAITATGISTARAADPPTFSKEIARILQANCIECHRPGEIAPMSLMTFEDARPWAKSIRAEVAARRMPPWHADPVAGPYKHDSSLEESEIETILAWVDAGAPRGDPADLPPPVEFPTGWKLGEPDQVFEMPVEFKMPADGGDVYRCFVLPAAEKEMWVRGVEFQPSNRRIDHHMVLYLDRSGDRATALDEREPEPGYTCFGGPGFNSVEIVGVWAPGARPDTLPEGIAWRLPEGSRLVLQMHFHPNGKDEVDRSEVGLHYAKTPVRKSLLSAISADIRLNIEPGDAEHASVTSYRFRRPVTVHAVFPHMHLLGKEYAMTARTPDGAVSPLVRVSRYDFNWQRTYYFEKPVGLPAGTVVDMKAVFDNSAANPNNPSTPPQRVRFGNFTTDEMNVGLIYYTYDEEDLIERPDRRFEAEPPNVGADGRAQMAQMLAMFADANGKVDLKAVIEQFAGPGAADAPEIQRIIKEHGDANGKIDVETLIRLFGGGAGASLDPR